MALLSATAAGSVATAAEAPRSASVVRKCARAARRWVWRSPACAGLFAAPVSTFAAVFACLLVCCLTIAVIPLDPHHATRDACTATGPALRARRVRDPEGPSTV